MDTDRRDRRSYTLRAYIILTLVLAYTGLTAYYLVKFQLFNKSPVKTHVIVHKLPAERGEITDRNGFKIAFNHLAYNVYQRHRIPDKYVPLLQDLGLNVKNSPSYWKKNPRMVRIASNIPAEKVKEIYGIPGLTFEKAWFRTYTDPLIFEPIVGCVQRTSGSGLEGLEFEFDKYLKGVPGRIAYLITNIKDSTKRNRYKIPLPDSQIVIPKKGCQLVLTIDQKLQTIAYEALKNGVDEWHAKRGAAIIEVPSTGEILAFAIYPSYDPGLYTTTNPSLKRIWPITDPYEPGSIFKVITYGTAISKGISPELMIDTDHGRIRIKNFIISDVHPLGRIPMKEALIHSSNVGTIKLAFMIGKRRIYSTIKRAGVGRKTGIKLPGENPGVMENYLKWDKTRFANVVIGYGFLINSLHIVTIYGAVANNGQLVYPRIVKCINCPDSTITYSVRYGNRLFPAPVTKTLKSILVDVVEKGTGRRAKIEGIHIAGKTGTANKLDRKSKRYNRSKRIVSFVGFFPAENPAYLIYVVVDEPHKKGFEAYGGSVAAPIFKNIVETMVNMGY